MYVKLSFSRIYARSEEKLWVMVLWETIFFKKNVCNRVQNQNEKL